MKLHIIFGQRACSYPGELAPEALDIADEYTMEYNSEWLDGKLKEHKANDDFTHVGILIVKVPDAAVDLALGIPTPEVEGTPPPPPK